MKFPIVFLSAILTFTSAEVDDESHGTRFLADRNVPLAELQNHTCVLVGLWTSLNGIVYDLTNYNHPGGARDLAKVGGIEGDVLYQKAVTKGKHPFSLAEVVSLPGIVRIGPLINATAMPVTTPTAMPADAKPTAMPDTMPTAMPIDATVMPTTKPVDRDVPLAELQNHTCVLAGLWTSLNGIVYDLTNYNHPGGATTLAKVGGIAGDALYARGVTKGKHNISLQDAVNLPGIVRIGPLINVTSMPTTTPTTMPADIKPTTMPTTTPTAMPADTKPTTMPVDTKPTAMPFTKPTAMPVTKLTIMPVSTKPTAVPVGKPTAMPAKAVDKPKKMKGMMMKKL